MALVKAANNPVQSPSQLPCNSTRRRFCQLKPSLFRCRRLASKARASSSVVIQTKPDAVTDDKKLNINRKILACPICYKPVMWEDVAQSPLQCSTCRKSYPGNKTQIKISTVANEKAQIFSFFFCWPPRGWQMGVFCKHPHIDLTINGGDKVYGEPMTSTVDAVHAGAALHCWTSPSAAVAEISRVLKPGGVFVATTYIVTINFYGG